MAFIKPMLASALSDGDALKNYPSDKFVMERKYDGERRILEVFEGGRSVAWSREGNAASIPDQIAAQLALLAPGVYDGEFLVPGGRCTDVKAEAKQHLVRCVLFDLLKVYHQGVLHSAMAKPYRERRAMLDFAVMHLDGTTVTLSEQVAPCERTLQAWKDAGGEGAIVKRWSPIYQSGERSRDWVKFKKLQSAPVIICGFVATKKTGLYAKIRAVDARGVEVTVKTLNADWRRKFAANPEAWYGRTLVIAFQDFTADGKYWHARADHLL